MRILELIEIQVHDAHRAGKAVPTLHLAKHRAFLIFIDYS